MKKIVIIGAVVAILIAVILTVWVIIGGISFLQKRTPELIATGEKAVKETIKKAEKALPGVKERAKEVVPALTEKVKELAPLGLPEKDVGGEDIKGIPRHPQMVRTFFEIKDQKRTIVYKGKAEFQSIIEYFNKEMTALSFKKKVVSASTDEEVNIYKKAKREFEFSFKKTGMPGLWITELTIREI